MRIPCAVIFNSSGLRLTNIPANGSAKTMPIIDMATLHIPSKVKLFFKTLFNSPSFCAPK